MILSGGVRFHDSLEPLMVPIDSVQPHPENYNDGDVDEIRASIRGIGMYGPIKVQSSTGHIVAGNHTWLVCKELGAQTIPVVALDIDDLTAKRVLVYDNGTARRAKPDHAALLSLLDQISDGVGTLEGSGYTDFDREAIKALADIPLEYDEFAQWPTLTLQVHPRLLKAYHHITREADTASDKFEVLLRLAGWNGT
jgi:hypothetical protein